MKYIKVDHAPKLCLWCEEVFKPGTKHQQFCNKNHYREYGKKFYGHSRGIREHRNQTIDKIKRPYRSHVKDRCERCNFIPEHICQLDVDHIDGNHKNNAPENLQTLCANCHRFKSHQERLIKEAPRET